MIHYCANDREVTGKDLSKHIGNLTGKIKIDDEEPFIYSAYISGKALDESVNSERTGFNMFNSDEDTLGNIITMKQIEDTAIGKIKCYLEKYTKPINEAKVKRIY